MKKTFVVLFMMVLAVSAFGQEQQGENFAFLSVVKGHVFLQEEQAKQDQYILQNDWLITESGTVDVRFGEEGGYLEVGENSKVFFVEVSSEKSVVVFFQGTVCLRNLENVELRAAGKPEGKIILSEKDKTIRVDIVGDNVNIENFEPAVVEPESETEVEPEKEQQNTNYYYYSYFWRFWGPYFSWYPGWYSWYPIYYNYGYYYGYYNYPYQYQNQNQYNYGGSYSRGSSVQRVVTKNQLQRRQITVRPSRVNTNFVRPTRSVVNRKVANFPSRVSLMRQSPKSSVSRTQSRTTSSYRTPVPTNSRNTTVSRSSSVNRSVSKPVNRSVSRSTSRPTSKPISRSASGKSTSGSIRKK